MPKNDENVPFFENITIDTLTVIQYRFFHVTIFILMSSGNCKIPYVVNYLVTVYKQAFGAYPLPKSNFLSFHYHFLSAPKKQLLIIDLNIRATGATHENIT